MTNVRLRVPILTIALAVVALYLFGKWQASQGAESGAIIQSSRNALAAGKAHRAHQARLLEVARLAGDRARAALAAAAARDTTVRRLKAQLAADTSARDSVVTLVATVATVEFQRDSAKAAAQYFRVKAVADSTRADRAEARIADLERNLAATLTVADCRMLGIKFFPRCPSRTVSFVVGAGTAALVLITTRR